MTGGWLHLPVRPGPGGRYPLQIWAGDVLLREFYLALTDGEDFDYFFLDLHYFEGKPVTLIVPEPGGQPEPGGRPGPGGRPDSGKLGPAALGRVLAGGPCQRGPLYPNLYREALRPQYHFSSKRGWLNDPNGLVYTGGVYHLYYQHNPLGTPHGGANISWGHAVSADLIHWEEHSDAILPWRRDWLVASGSALVDTDNAAGYGKDAIIAAFTALGATDPQGGGYPSGGQFMAASTDGGESFYRFSAQAAVPTQQGLGWRDPRLFRYGDHYVMAVYETLEGRNCVSFYVSENLRAWRWASRNMDLYECPDIFPLTAGDGVTKWALFGADGLVRLGHFDGYGFIESGEAHPLDYGDATYAGQTWNGHPEGKRVHISWVRGMGDLRGEVLGYQGMPFSQCMSLPCELSLDRGPEGYRVLRRPVAQAQCLRGERQPVEGALPLELPADGPCEYALRVSDIEDSALIFAGRHCVRFEPRAKTLWFENGRACKLAGETLDLRVFIDTTTMELFFGEGIAATYAMAPEDRRLALAGSGRAYGERWGMGGIWG
jgi:fructan beta-fructosidase